MGNHPFVTRIVKPADGSLDLAATFLEAGETVAIPTETVYGLAANAENEAAVAKIFAAKERPTFDPLIVHISSEIAKDPEKLQERGWINWNALGSLAQQRYTQLTNAFWPGPLTLILPKGPAIPDLVTSGLPTVGIRVPNHPVTLDLLKRLRFPLAAPSANRFGRISPTLARAVFEELYGRIPLILDGGPCAIGIESTIIRLSPDGGISLLRPGGISREQIEACIGAGTVGDSHSKNSSGPQVAPGLLESHYAPSKPFRFLPKPIAAMTADDWREWMTHAPLPIGILMIFGNPASQQDHLRRLGLTSFEVRTLAENTGDWANAAAQLFQTMRDLDQSKAESLCVEPIDQTQGLAFAIRDRLNRATALSK